METTQNSQVIKVGIVDDDDRLKSLLQMVINEAPGFLCEKTYSSCDEALYDYLVEAPDVILMDIDMPKINGIECVQRMKEFNPGTAFIMLTGREDSKSVFESLCAGASGFLLKGIPIKKLLNAIKEVHNGGAYINPSTAKMIISYLSSKKDSSVTNREKQILELLSQHETMGTIAQNFRINHFTVKQHIRNIYKKLEITNSPFYH